jgi:peroxiredoxin
MNEKDVLEFMLQTHLPGFVASFAKFQAAGAEVIVFTAVNDPFVLTEWGVVNNAIGKASMYPLQTQITHNLQLSDRVPDIGMGGSILWLNKILLNVL